MAFQNNYANLVAQHTEAHTRLIRNYDGTSSDFDIVVIGSGMGGGILADDLADRFGSHMRILVLDIGSFIYPTHVYNVSRIPNYSVAKHFDVKNYQRLESQHHYIGGRPQMALGGRSIFWSGLIPEAQEWELAFFPDTVRQALSDTYLASAADKMNESISLGTHAAQLVEHFRNTNLHDDFEIKETPRALHQPYLNADGSARDRFFVEPTGVFNTAELLINQLGLTPGANQEGNGLFLKLNSFVEGITEVPFNWYEIKTTDTVTGAQRSFYSPKVVIAAGSTESPKLINRSSFYGKLPKEIQSKVGFGLTDHPVSSESQAYVTSLDGIPITRNDHAKILFYSRGEKDANGHIKFPFNIEMNVNHEYWHLRNNDPSARAIPDNTAKSRIDIKFSFANCLDDENGIYSHANDGYTPAISFKRFAWLDDLLNSRFPAVAGWNKSQHDFFNLLNGTRDRVFSEFNGLDWITGEYGGGPGQQWPFGWGTVHHACGTLRMPWKPNLNSDFHLDSVVDENLKVTGTAGVYVCDMSVMPISTAANPVRTMGGLALRLSEHLT